MGRSSRIREDLQKALELNKADSEADGAEVAGLTSLAILVREWVPMHPGFEFRGFVYKRILTALSQVRWSTLSCTSEYVYTLQLCCEQYCYLQYFEELHAEGVLERVEDAIRNFFANVSERLPHENAIVDFVVFPQRDWKVQIVEINPFVGVTLCSPYFENMCFTV